MSIDSPPPQVAPELAGALCAAQGEFGTIEKRRTATGTKFSYQFADLSDVFAAVRTALSKHGLAIIQRPTVRATDDGGYWLEVETILVHTSGAAISSNLALPISDASPQGIGSALTYCRRYSVLSILGIAPADEDDDGAAAQAPPKPAKAPRKKPVAQRPQATPNQIKLIWATARKHAQGLVEDGDAKELSEEIVRKAIAPLESTRDLQRAQVDGVLERISTFDIGTGISEEPKG